MTRQHPAYNLPGTSCAHPEQHTGAYTDPSFWRGYQNDYERYKNELKAAFDTQRPYVAIRYGHSEFSLIKWMATGKRPRKWLTGRHVKGTPPPAYLRGALESILLADASGTQIGYNFMEWGRFAFECLKRYKEYRKRPNVDSIMGSVRHHFPQSEDECTVFKDPKAVMRYPTVDFTYALMGNKWILETFRNQIGVVTHAANVSGLKELIKRPGHRAHILQDVIVDYIEVPETAGFSDPGIEDRLVKQIRASPARVLLFGVGPTKLRFFHRLHDLGPRLYIDIGFTMDAICRNRPPLDRPYFGSWEKS